LTKVVARGYFSEMKKQARPFTDEFKIYCGSLEEIRDALDDSVTTIARTKIRFGRLKLKRVQVLSALVLWFVRQTKDIQAQIMRETMPVLLKHADSPIKLDIEPSVDSAIGWAIAHGRKGRHRATLLDSDSLDEAGSGNRGVLPKVGV
jgi:hypothetical protein